MTRLNASLAFRCCAECIWNADILLGVWEDSRPRTKFIACHGGNYLKKNGAPLEISRKYKKKKSRSNKTVKNLKTCDGRDFKVKVWISFKHKGQFWWLVKYKEVTNTETVQECVILWEAKKWHSGVQSKKDTRAVETRVLFIRTLINYTKKSEEENLSKVLDKWKKSPLGLVAALFPRMELGLYGQKVTLTTLTFNFLPTWTFRPCFGGQLLVYNRDIFPFKYNL